MNLKVKFFQHQLQGKEFFPSIALLDASRNSKINFNSKHSSSWALGWLKSWRNRDETQKMWMLERVKVDLTDTTGKMRKKKQRGENPLVTNRGPGLHILYLSITFAIGIMNFPNKLWSSAGNRFRDFEVLGNGIGFDGVLWCLVSTFEFGKHGRRRHHIGFD